MKRFNMVLPPQIYTPVKAMAERDGRTISDLIRQAVLEFIARQNKQ